jgi:hypothetical protein
MELFQTIALVAICLVSLAQLYRDLIIVRRNYYIYEKESLYKDKIIERHEKNNDSLKLEIEKRNKQIRHLDSLLNLGVTPDSVLFYKGGFQLLTNKDLEAFESINKNN